MVHDEDNNQFNEVTGILRQLQKVNAPQHFEADLMRRINSGRFENKIKQNFWDILLLPSRLIPATAIAAIAIIFTLNTSPAEQENPFSVEPKVRENISGTETNKGLSLDEEMKSISEKNVGSLKREYYSQRQSAASFISTSYFNKSGLNYRQIHLTDKQKEKINRLREKFNSYLRNTGGAK